MMRDMSLIDKTSDPCRVGLFSLGIGQQTYDPSGITPFFHGRDQQTSDACSVDRSGKDFHDSPHRCDMFVAWNGNYPFSPRRGGMSVEQITDLQPSPCKGDMILSITFDLCEVDYFFGEFGQQTYDPFGITPFFLGRDQQTSDTCGVLPYLYRLNYISPAAFGKYVHKYFDKEI